MFCVRSKRIIVLSQLHISPTTIPLFASQARFLSTSIKKMSKESMYSFASEADVSSFQRQLFHSKRVLALCGAGLSAASGLPTFRGAGGMWKSRKATDLATPEAFEEDPGLVWQFYAYRRHTALKAQPNPAHFALAALARKKPGFVCLSQNVDGLSPRAKHPESQLHLLHGSLLDIKCFNELCDYVDKDNTTDPLCEALAVDLQPSTSDNSGSAATSALYSAMNLPSKTTDSSTSLTENSATNKKISLSELPKCPKCNSLLRPGVVWFGEKLPLETINAVDTWIDESRRIDLMMVIGTTAEVWPAAGYIHRARSKGARIAVINIDHYHLRNSENLRAGDFVFEGDAAEVLPILFEGILEN